MPFDFELTLTGLIVLAFDDETYSKGHAILVRTDDHHPDANGGDHGGHGGHGGMDHGDHGGHGGMDHGSSHYHRPSLAYEISALQKEGTLIPSPDLILSDPFGYSFATRELENEILTLAPTFAGDPPERIFFHRADPLDDLTSLAARREPWIDHTPILTEMEPNLVQPVSGNLSAGIVPSCLGNNLENSPCVARVDFDRCEILTGKLSTDSWESRRIGSQVGSGTSRKKFLANQVLLRFPGVLSMEIGSNRYETLHFESVDESVPVSVTNEPTGHELFDEERLEHFEMFYRVVQWQDTQFQVRSLVVPHVEDTGAPRTIYNKICPVATYAI